MAIDMTDVCTEEKTRITSASAVPEDMGAEAGRIIVQATRGSVKGLMDVILPANLRILDSTGTLASKAILQET